MQDAKELLPLVGYRVQWIIIGALLLLVTFAWIGFIFWHTRQRVQKTVSTLAPHKIAAIDLAALKNKYIALIDEAATEHQQNKLTARQTHQKLSLIVRFFVFEATGFPAQVMTLSDIERRNFPTLQSTIAAYYPDEFEALLKGNVTVSVTKAKDMVTTWQ